MEDSRSNKSLRKCTRKQKRAQHRLARDMNVEFSDEPTQYVAVCNGGLVTGLRRETLEQFIDEFTTKFHVVMPPGKSYCFVNFFSNQSARNFFEKVHGLVRVPSENTFFYLLYIKSIPCIEESLGNELPPGLRLLTDFVTEEEERFLLESINWEEEEEAPESELKHRQVKHFGYRFRYDNNSVDVDDPIAPIPETYGFLQSSFEEHHCGDWKYDQITVNRYLPGQGIPPHVDTHDVFEDPILSLSLGSACVMDFRRGERRVALDLPARSLLVMGGEARYAWSHGICPRRHDNVQTESGLTTRPRATRVSLTFRKIRRGECECGYDGCCGGVNDGASTERTVGAIDETVASDLESRHVHEVYEEISGHFDETRHKQWPNVAKFIETVETGGLLLDVGCGNGKYLFGRESIYKMGCDRSTGLAGICRNRGFQVLLADCLRLPYRSDALDAVVCIAVIHHLSTGERRRQALLEIMRVLRVGGRTLVYVWAKEQSRDAQRSTYLRFGGGGGGHRNGSGPEDEETRRRGTQFRTVERNVRLPVHENRTEFTHSDVLVPWKRKGGGDFLRFYHVFESGELESLCSSLPRTAVRSVYYDQGNWCVVLEKM